MKKHNILPSYDIILDNPYETEKDLEGGLNFLLKIERPYILHAYSLINFPKTNLTKRLMKDGLGVENSEKALIQWRKNVDDEESIFNAKISLLSKSFIPKLVIKKMKNKTYVLILTKIANNLQLILIGLKLIFTGKTNISLLKHYIKNYKGVVI